MQARWHWRISRQELDECFAALDYDSSRGFREGLLLAPDRVIMTEDADQASQGEPSTVIVQKELFRQLSGSVLQFYLVEEDKWVKKKGSAKATWVFLYCPVSLPLVLGSLFLGSWTRFRLACWELGNCTSKVGGLKDPPFLLKEIEAWSTGHSGKTVSHGTRLEWKRSGESLGGA